MNYTKQIEGINSKNEYWSEEKKQVAILCEDKNSRLYYDELQHIYFIVKKYDDGSVLHTRETELFCSANISEVREFIKNYKGELKTFYFNTGVRMSSSPATYKGDIWSNGGSLLIPFDCYNVPEKTTLKYLCDNVPESDKDAIIREVFNTRMLSKYAIFTNL